VFLVGPCRETGVSRSSLVGSGPLQSSLSFASARPSLHRRGPFKKEPNRSGTSRVRLSWGSCSRGHNYVGCPFSVTRFLAVAREGRGSPDPRRCRPQGSCPSRRFRLSRGSLEAFWTPPFAVDPDASRPSFMPLASLELPSRAFPSRGAVPALAGLLLPCGFALRHPPAQCLQEIRGRFHPSRQPFAARARPEADPGRMSRDERFPAIARPVASTRKRAARTVHFPPTLGSPVRDRHARFEALLPPGVRSATTSSPGQAEAARRCSPGVLDPPELTPLRFGVRYLASTCAGGQSPMPRTPPGAQPSRLHSATRTPTPELASPGSVDAKGL
jgi:hypothetical protein